MVLKVGSDLIVSAMNVHIVDLLIAVYSAIALYDDWNVKYKSTHHKLPIKYTSMQERIFMLNPWPDFARSNCFACNPA